MASRALTGQTVSLVSRDRLPLDELEETFQAELAEVREWYRQVREDELRWIREGKDVDAEFARKYYEQPAVSRSLTTTIKQWLARPRGFAVVALIAVGLLVSLTLLSILTSLRWRRRKGTLGRVMY